MRVLGLEQQRTHETEREARTVGSLLTALFAQPDGTRPQNAESIQSPASSWQLARKLADFEAGRVAAENAVVPGPDDGAPLIIVAAAQRVAEALWLQGKAVCQQVDKRDTRSSVCRNGLAAPLLEQKDAEAVREILMAERGNIGKNWQGESFERQFSLCEH